MPLLQEHVPQWQEFKKGTYHQHEENEAVVLGHVYDDSFKTHYRVLRGKW